MASKEIEAGKAFLKLLVDDKELTDGLNNSVAKLEGMRSAAIKIGGAITASFAGGLAVFRKVGDELATMSQRTGLSAQSLSELKFAAQQSGTSLGTVEKAMRQMQKAGLDPTSFDSVASAISKIEDPAKRAEAAFKKFGRSAPELLPMLADIDKLREKARELGVTMDDDAAASANELDDAFNALKLQSTALAAALGQAVAPAITELAEQIQPALGHLIHFIEGHQELMAITALLGVTMVEAAHGFYLFGGACEGVTAALHLLRIAMTFVARHPLLIAFTLLVAGVTLLADRMGWLEKLFGSTADEEDKATDATKAHAEAEGELGAAMGKTTTVFDARKEALKELSAGERRLISDIEARQRAEETGAAKKELVFEAEREKVRSELQRARGEFQQRGGLVSAAYPSVGGKPSVPLDVMYSQSKSYVADLEAKFYKMAAGPQATELGKPVGFGAPAGAREMAVSAGFKEASRKFQESMAIQGAVPFAFNQRVLDWTVDMDETKKVAAEVSGPRGTFSGRYAQQMLGGADPASRDRKEQIKLAKEQRDALNVIKRKQAGGMRAGTG